jgi:hypothetical protein
MKQFLIALDQLINTVFGGMADETLSARAYRQKLKGHTTPVKIIDAVFFWQENHCYTSYEAELKRKQLPSSYTV